MMRWIDLPPVWLAAFVALAWLQARFWSLGLSLDFPVTQAMAGLCIGGGVILMLLAVVEMRRHNTTVIPHRDANRLVQSGIFKRTRNPIYLGDVLVLLGLILRFDAVLSLLFVPVLIWLLERRFIVPEENRLRRRFREEYALYISRVRRWV